MTTPAATAPALDADLVSPSSVLRLHDLTTTAQGDRVVVGHPATAGSATKRPVAG